MCRLSDIGKRGFGMTAVLPMTRGVIKQIMQTHTTVSLNNKVIGSHDRGKWGFVYYCKEKESVD